MLVNRAVVTNVSPYILSMAALAMLQRVAKVPVGQAKTSNIIAGVGMAYSFYALYSSGYEAMMWGSLATFFGWTLYGLIASRFAPCAEDLET